jgi:hypothetical protein
VELFQGVGALLEQTWFIASAQRQRLEEEVSGWSLKPEECLKTCFILYVFSIPPLGLFCVPLKYFDTLFFSHSEP